MIYVTGDTHGDFLRFSKAAFTEQCDMTRDDRIIICGDFGGIWRGCREDEYWLKWLANKNFTLCFVDGNHENFDLLNSYNIVDYCGGKAHMIRDNIFHLMRGEVFDFEGYKFFTFGGARSHDIDGGVFEPTDYSGIASAKKGTKSFRVNHVSWWKEEMPNEDEMRNGIDNLSKVDNNVDFVITHSLPTQVLKSRWWFMDGDDVTRYFDNLLSDGLKFKHWYAGHYHVEERIMGSFDILYHKICRIV